MKEICLNSQAYIIEDLLEVIDTSSIGLLIKDKYDIKKSEKNPDTLVFTLKEGKMPSPEDFFWLGYHCNNQLM